VRKGLSRYLVRRGLQSLFLIWLSTVIAFTIYQLAPGGPLQFLNDNPKHTSADLIRLNRLYGLDRPMLVQYVAWLTGEDWFSALPGGQAWQSGQCIDDPSRCSRGILRLDFGRSFYFAGESVLHVIAQRIPATFLLGFSGLIVSIAIGIPAGIYAALNRGRWPDHFVRVTTVVVNAVPDWWIGLLLLIILGGYLGLVPLGGMQSVDGGSLLDLLHHLILPAFVSAIGGWISISRFLRFEMLEVLNQDYVRTARAKGLSERAVIVRHVVRNAVMPLVTGLSGILLLFLSGSILFELVFSWPGMGRLAVTAINARDYPVMMGLFVISSFLGIVGILMVDVLYGFVDPRVNYEL
jgi:peptide/nickel transport system permease protein